MIRLGDSGGDGKIGPTSSTPTLVPHPREPIGKPPFVCVSLCACDLPAQTQLHPNVFTLWQEHIAKLFTSHPAIRYAAYARGGVPSRVTRQQRNPLAVARLHSSLPPSSFRHQRVCGEPEQADLGSLLRPRFFPTFRRLDLREQRQSSGALGCLIGLQHPGVKTQGQDFRLVGQVE